MNQNIYYHSGINQMLADNWWQRLATQSNNPNNIIRLPIGFQPWQITTSPQTNAVFLAGIGLLAAGMVASSYFRNH